MDFKRTLTTVLKCWLILGWEMVPGVMHSISKHNRMVSELIHKGSAMYNVDKVSPNIRVLCML